MKSTVALLSFATLSTLASSATFDVDVEMMVANALASSKGVASGSPLLGHRRKLGATGKYAVIEHFDGAACTSTKNMHMLVHLDECITFTTSGQTAAIEYTQMAVNKVGMSVWLGATCTGTAAAVNLMADSACTAATNTTAISPYTLKDSDVMFDLYSDSACMVHASASSGLNMDSFMDFIMPAGAEVCVAGSGSDTGKSSKIIADSTGVTLSQHTVADCTGTAAETIKITPGKCTPLPAAFSSEDSKVQYAYLGGSPGACEAGVFKGNCPPTGSAVMAAGLSITALAGLAAVAIANFV